MAKFSTRNYTVTINSVDLSDHIEALVVEDGFSELETSAFGSGHRSYITGIGEGSCQITFHQDFAANEVYATIEPLLDTTTTVVCKPTSAAVGATNPSATFDVLVSKWTPFNAGSPDEVAKFSVTWPKVSAITWATS